MPEYAILPRVQATENGPSNGSSAGGGIIEQIIRKYVEDACVVFVFPTEIAAKMWQERALGFHPQAALPDERFLPWDRFKGIHAARAEAGKAEVHERVRELYAESLAKRNAAEAARGKPLLRFAIPKEFAESAQLFSPWIAGILPHLAFWEEKGASLVEAARLADAEDRDLAFILEDYKAFLDRSKLFEPSWCRRFEGGGKKHIIFFHEAIQGFGAYEAAIRPRHVGAAAELPDAAPQLADFTAVAAPAFSGEAAHFSLCGDFREEFRRVALKIEELLARGEDCNSIAVSLSDAQESEPYLSRELETRGIHARIRIKRALAESGAGRIFPLIQQCRAEDFSFNSVKKLLSLKSIAWKDPDLAADLVRFGIKNRCLCSWREDGKLVDAWERALVLAGSGASDSLRRWYKRLKRNVLALCGAKSFAGVRKAWFDFRCKLLDIGKTRDEGEEGKSMEDREIGLCIKELDALAEAEQSFPELAPRGPFSFFVARLKRTTYVPQSEEGGVSVFKLKDAAAAPFKFHFVTGATQEDATALHSELRFLRKDKRDALDKEEDASLPLFSSYMNGAESGSGVFFSASRRGVGGYKTEHSAFAGRAGMDEGDALLPDPLEMEERQERPPRAYPVQKAGLEAYSLLNGDKAARFSFLKEGFEGNADEAALRHIKERIAERQKTASGDVRVSATDLKDYAACPAKWLMEKVFCLGALGFAPELDIVDAGERGSIFHEVAKNLYKLIREKGGAFHSEDAALYLKAAEEIIPKAIEDALGRAGAKSPLAEPTRRALAARLREGVEALVSADSYRLDGLIPVMTEEEVCFREGGMEFEGRIDRISKSGDGELTAIVDYKTGDCPTASAYEPVDGKMEDFQMPFYVFLCEKKLGASVTQAWFFSVKDKKYAPILNINVAGDKTKDFHANTKYFKSGGEFMPAIRAMRAAADAFSKAVSAVSFCAEGVYADTCQDCAFRAVCRHAYSVARD